MKHYRTFEVNEMEVNNGMNLLNASKMLASGVMLDNRL